MLVIGIAGGSGSGKTTVVKAITEQLNAKRVVVIPQDSYYKDSSPKVVESVSGSTRASTLGVGYGR